jgi:hypothetical protein
MRTFRIQLPNLLVWGGRNRTQDPTKLGTFTREIVDEG